MTVTMAVLEVQMAKIFIVIAYTTIRNVNQLIVGSTFVIRTDARVVIITMATAIMAGAIVKCINNSIS